MYIRDNRVRSRRALYKGGRGIAGLGDDCSDYGGVTQSDGTCQVTITNSSTAPSTATETTSDWLNQTSQGVTTTGTPSSSSSGSSWTDAVSGGLTGLLKALSPTAAPTLVSTGPSTTEILVLGALGIGAVMLLTRKRSSGGDD